MRVIIREFSLREKEIILEVPNYNITIKELKKIYNRYQYNGLNYQFKFDGVVLRNDKKRLSDYGYEEGDVVSSFRPCGGGGPTLENPGPTHLCPYGCGRQIPNGYNGCTELLKEIPGFFG